MRKICIFHKYLKVALYKIWSCIVLRNIILLKNKLNLYADLVRI